VYAFNPAKLFAVALLAGLIVVAGRDYARFVAGVELGEVLQFAAIRSSHVICNRQTRSVIR